MKQAILHYSFLLHLLASRVELTRRHYRIPVMTNCQWKLVYGVTYGLVGQNDIKLVIGETNVAEEINK